MDERTFNASRVQPPAGSVLNCLRLITEPEHYCKGAVCERFSPHLSRIAVPDSKQSAWNAERVLIHFYITRRHEQSSGIFAHCCEIIACAATFQNAIVRLHR